MEGPLEFESVGALPSHRYEIAEPIAYPVFTLPGAAKSVSLDTTAGLEEPGPYHEAWDDREKKSYLKRLANLNRIPEIKTKLAEEIEIPREIRAIWIVHGMGQQIPFETVDSLARGILRVATPKNTKPRLRTVKIGDQIVQRVELDVDGFEKEEDQEPGKPGRRGKTKKLRKPKRYYELHLYESYWAPKTEGVAKLADVISFLLDGGSRGLMNWYQRFKRAMFGGMEEFNISGFTPIWISLALLVLLALTVINGVIVAAEAEKVKLGSFEALHGHWEQLAALASCMTAVAFTFGTILFLAELSKPSGLPWYKRLSLSITTWMTLGITMIAILGTALLMAMLATPALAAGQLKHLPRARLQGFATVVILCCFLLVLLAMWRRAWLRSSASSLPGDGWLLFLFFIAFVLNLVSVIGPVRIWMTRAQAFPYHVPSWLDFLHNSFWVWPFLIALSAKIRTLMIEYVGDVAIYVTANKLDRFEEVRNKIKEAARSVASAVYLACQPKTNNFLYKQIALVGHSLGSVIAYDTLNRLMLDDWLSKNYLGIAHRTNSLVTFGSPLNKTAFLFTIQGKDTLHIRERLAATVQPLIQSYDKFRKFKWINVFSRNDIICGSLTFYDLPGMQQLVPLPREAVDNVKDRDAAVPLVAHVDYWKNTTVWQKLYEQIAP